MKALIVDDELINRILLTRFIADYFDVDVCDNAKHAIEMFKDAHDKGSPYDLLCLDIMMPQINGKELLLMVRTFEEKIEITRENYVKVIMATALSDANEIMDAFRAGCESYLVKPIDKCILLKEIEKLGLITL
ncbi:response regulator [bacterium]|nr:response regulator [bacterium]